MYVSYEVFSHKPEGGSFGFIFLLTLQEKNNMAIKKISTKKNEAKPKMLKEVKIVAKALPRKDSVTVGYGEGKKSFAVKDVKKAVKSGTLKADTSSYRKLSNSLGGNSDKADRVNLAINMAKKKKK